MSFAREGLWHSVSFALVFSTGILLPVIPSATDRARLGAQHTKAIGESSIHGGLKTAQGRPLVQARVMLRNLHGEAHWRDVTDQQGRFRFDNLSAGTYLLSMSHGRYVARFEGPQLTEQAGRIIRLGPREALTSDVTAVRGGAVTGTVFDGLGEPMPDVSVRAYRQVIRGGRRVLAAVDGKSYPSNDLGHYRVANLPTGRYIVATHYSADAGANPSGSAERFGFPQTWYPGLSHPDRAQKLRVKAGQDVVGVDFTLRPTTFVQISGSVTTFSGTPAAGAEVWARPAIESGGTTKLGARASTSGEFVISNVQPGDYVLTARSASGVTIETGIEPSPSAYGTVRVPVGDYSVQGISIQLRPAARITGRLQGDGPLPRRAVALLISDDPGSRPYRAAISEAGDFTIDVGPGHYRFAISGLPNEWILERVLTENRDVTTEPFVIQPSMPLTLTVQASSQGATLTGYVADAVSGPCANCAVVAMPEDLTQRVPALDAVKLTRTDTRGQFAAQGLRAGTYLVLALPHVDMAYVYDEELWAYLERHGQRVNVVKGEVKQIAAPFADGAQ